MSSQKIIIDTDPGQDDAIGILLALASPEELDLLGIVTVAGNVPLELTSRNALILLLYRTFIVTHVVMHFNITCNDIFTDLLDFIFHCTCDQFGIVLIK